MAASDAQLAQMAQKLRRHSPRVDRRGRLRAPDDLHVRAPRSMSVLFFDEMRFDPARSQRERRRRLRAVEGPRGADPVGRASSEAGAIDDDLLTLRRLTAASRAIPRRSCPGCAWPRGSLGQGLCAAVGMAWARRTRRRARAACSACWATARWRRARCGRRPQFASFNGLDNLMRDRGRQPPGPERAHHVPARHRRSYDVAPARLRLGRGDGRRATTWRPCARRWPRAAR